MSVRVKVLIITPTKLNTTTRSEQSWPNPFECSTLSPLNGRITEAHFKMHMPVRAGLFDIANQSALYDNAVYRDEALSCC